MSWSLSISGKPSEINGLIDKATPSPASADALEVQAAKDALYDVVTALEPSDTFEPTVPGVQGGAVKISLSVSVSHTAPDHPAASIFISGSCHVEAPPAE